MDALFNCFVASVEDAEKMVNGRWDLLTIYMSRCLLNRFGYYVTINGRELIPKTFRGIELKIVDIPHYFYCVGCGYYE